MICLILFIKLCFVKGQQTIYLTENENYILQEKSIILEINNSNDFNNLQYILVSKEIRRLSQGLIQSYYNYTFIDPVYDIITFRTFDKNDIYVCLIKYSQIECNQKILNMLVNDELIVYQNRYYTFNQTNCYNIHNVIENQFILQCKSENGLQLFLINSNDIILNTLQITKQYNNTLNSLITENQLILYENSDVTIYFYFISYNNSKLYQKQKILDLNNFQDIGNIQTLKVEKNNQIRIFCQYSIFDLDILSFDVIVIKNNKLNNYDYYSSIIYQQMEYFIAINYKQNDDVFMQKDIIFINSQCKQIISINFINENILINCQQQFLTIYNNNLMSLKLDINMKSIKYLEELPFIIVVNKTSNMEFLKINDLPNYFCNLSSSNIFAYYVKNFIVYDNPIKVIQQKYSLQNPLLILNNVSFGTFYVSKDIKLFHYSLIFQQGLPYSIENTYFNESSLKSIKTKFVFEEQMGMVWGQQIFLCKIFYNLSFTTITYKTNGTFTINDSNQLIQFQIEFNSNNSKIYFSTQQNQFLIIQNQTIRAYSFDKKVNLIWIMKIENNITNIFRYHNILLIQLEECMEIEIDLNTLNRKQINNSLQHNCTYYLNSYFLIKINSQEINLYSKLSYNIRIICHQIIEFVPVIIYKLLILFELIDDKIQIKLYITKFGQFNFLYYLPLYEFQIVYPLEYRIEKALIAILASDQMNQQYVLIYNIKNQVANSLVKVIRIDSKNYYFNFLSEFQIFVVFQQQLIIYFLSCLELQFQNQHLKFDNLISQEDKSLQIISDIYNQSLQIQLKVISINMDYKIQIKDRIIPFQYLINQKQQIKTFNFENIFGNIDFVLKLNPNNSLRLEPMQIKYAFSCSSFYSKNSICVNYHNIRFNNFENSIQLEIPESCLRFVFVQDKIQYFSFYCWIDLTKIKRLDVNKYGFIMRQKMLNISDFNIDLLFMNQTLIVQNVLITYSKDISNQAQIFFVEENSISLFKHEGNSIFNTATVTYNNNHYIILYSLEKENRKYFLYAIIMDNLFNIQNQIQFKLEEIISDYNYIIFNNLKEVQFIDYNLIGMILKTDSIFCFEIFSCIRLDLQIDFSQRIINKQINNYIRFPENTKCLFNCYQGNQQNLILTLILNKNRVSYFYNLTQKRLIDSFYQYSAQNIQFQQYNNTHYVQINITMYSSEVSLFQLSGYQIQCQDQCQGNIEKVQINNQVSILDLELNSIQYQNKLIVNPNNYTQFIICLNNFIILLLFIRYYKKRRNPFS